MPLRVVRTRSYLRNSYWNTGLVAQHWLFVHNSWWNAAHLVNWSNALCVWQNTQIGSTCSTLLICPSDLQ